MSGPMLTLGLMSGTSLDAIDAALVRIATVNDRLELELVAWSEQPWPPELRSRLAAWIETDAAPRAGDLAAASMEAGFALADAAAAACAAAETELSDVDLIASHGQTIAHEVDQSGRVLGTLQLGEPAAIAERTGRTVVADFRPRDVAAGGQGAPLTGFDDALLCAAQLETVAVLNLGGIANVTVVPAGAPQEGLAWDVGPGNAVVDALARRLLGRPFDEAGAASASGTAHGGLLDELLAEAYFARRPPKSTGREEFGDRYTERLIAHGRRLGLADADLLATASALTGRAVAQELTRWGTPMPAIVHAAGGGTANATLMHGIERALARIGAEGGRAPALRGMSELGLPAEAREAIGFAVLGHEALHGRQNSLPAHTGARHPSVLGAIWPGANYRQLLERVARSQSAAGGAGRIGRIVVTSSGAAGTGGSR